MGLEPTTACLGSRTMTQNALFHACPPQAIVVHFYFPNSVKAVAIARRPDINGRSGTAVFLGVRETIVK